MTRIACSPLVRVERRELVRQALAEQALVARRELRAQIDDFDLGSRTRDARQHEALDLATHRPAEAHDVRRGTAQHDRGTGQTPDHDGHVARLVARRAVRLVRRIVLLVDDDDARIGQRRERGDARAHDDPDLARADAPPLVGALALAQRAVQQGDFLAQIVAQPIQQRHRQAISGTSTSAPLPCSSAARMASA